jgi:hypothetical protein
MGEAHSFSSFFFWFFFSLNNFIFILLQTLIHIEFIRMPFMSGTSKYEYICFAGNKRKRALQRCNLPGIFPDIGALIAL